MSAVPGHLVWVDGPEVLFELLHDLPAGTLDEQDLRTTTFRPQGLPADLYEQVAGGMVAVCVYRGGWTNDADRVDGHDSVVVDLYAPTASIARDVSRAIEIMLVDSYHDTSVGFVDDVEIGTRFREVPSPIDSYAQTSAAYRVISRPD